MERLEEAGSLYPPSLSREIVVVGRFGQMKKPYRIYVAGPYTRGDVVQNVRTAIITGNNLRALGFTPFIPHLTHFWHMIQPHDIDYWYKYDFEWLDVCDALFRLPGESKGADAEEARARELGLKIFYNFGDLREVLD